MSTSVPERAHRLFVSHSHADNVFCRRLVESLRAAGLDVWYDESDLRGADLDSTIERELRSRDTYVVVFSPQAVESRWVRSEWIEALERFDKGELKYFLPVIANTSELPIRIKPLVWTDFVNKDYNETFSLLLKRMGFSDNELRTFIPTNVVPTIWELKETINTHVGGFGLAWSPDGKLIALGSHDKKVTIWDIATRKSVQTLVGHNNWVDAVAWSPNGKYIASASQGTRVRIWEVASGRQSSVLEGHSAGVRDVAWSPDGNYLVSGSEDGTLRVWNIASGRSSMTVKVASVPLTSATWSPDSKHLGSSARDASIRIWDAYTGDEEYSLIGHHDVAYCMRWSPDCTMIASSGHTTIRVWNCQQRSLITKCEGHRGHVVSVAWRPDGAIIASASADYTVRLWGPRGEKYVITPGMHADWVHDVAWSPNGMLLASCAGINDGTIKLWGPQ